MNALLRSGSQTAGGTRVNEVVFSGAGTYTYVPSPGLISLVVECIGGGGGGGGSVGTFDGTSGWLVTAGGGGSGGYSRSTLDASLVLGGVIVTVAAGGAGGTPPGVADMTTGLPAAGFASTGGTTTFGGLVSANGGGGAQNTNPYGGAPGSWAGPGIGQLTVVGNSGHAGQSMLQDAATGGNLTGGTGGPSFLGGAGMGAYIATNAGDGDDGAFGGGGGGAGSGNTTLVTGGNGGDGVCIVTEYILVSSAGGGGGTQPCPPNPSDPCWPNNPPNVCWPGGGWWRDDC